MQLGEDRLDLGSGKRVNLLVHCLLYTHYDPISPVGGGAARSLKAASHSSWFFEVTSSDPAVQALSPTTEFGLLGSSGLLHEDIPESVLVTSVTPCHLRVWLLYTSVHGERRMVTETCSCLGIQRASGPGDWSWTRGL